MNTTTNPHVRADEARADLMEAEVHTARAQRVSHLALAFQRLAFGASALIVGAAARALIGA